MPTRNADLTDELERFVLDKVAQGRMKMAAMWFAPLFGRLSARSRCMRQNLLHYARKLMKETEAGLPKAMYSHAFERI